MELQLIQTELIKSFVLTPFCFCYFTEPLEAELNQRFDGLPKPVSTEAIKEIVNDYAKRYYGTCYLMN